jgi:predicted RNA-binding Zn-ribbon protein involved in translation (DUF1610 family)
MNENICTEWCQHCETEVEISTEMIIQRCPNCGKYIIPCSMCDCDYADCSKCELSKICETKNN